MSPATCKVMESHHVANAIEARRLARGCRKIEADQAADLLWDRVRTDLRLARRYRRLANQRAA